MLTIFLRTVIIFIVVTVLYRLMGKRQIGEMEPYELVITLLIADIVSVPLTDKFIPISYGIISAIALFFMHQLAILLSKNTKMQHMISGKPILVIDKDGINYESLQKMSMQTADLLQTMRSSGYFSLEAINYALMETNGQLSIIANDKYEQSSDSKNLPIPVILDGQWSQESIADEIDKEGIMAELKKLHLKLKDIILFTINEQSHAVIQSKKGKYFTKNFDKNYLSKEKATQ